MAYCIHVSYISEKNIKEKNPNKQAKHCLTLKKWSDIDVLSLG